MLFERPTNNKLLNYLDFHVKILKKEFLKYNSFFNIYTTVISKNYIST